MTLAPKRKMKRKLSYFEDSGSKLKKYPLIRAVYDDSTEKALKIIKIDPDQINLTDPFAGLTALHVAIFRQNETLVTSLAKHPISDLSIKDNFNRRSVDMLDYTTNQIIFEAVIDATYPEDMLELENLAYEQGKAENVITPFKPKDP